MHALRVLEYGSVLERLANECETPLGAERALALEPDFEEEEVWDALELTASAHELLAKDSPPALSAVRDLRGALDRAAKGGSLAGEDLFRIAECLSAMRQCRRFLESRKEGHPRLWRIAEPIPEAPRLEQALFDALEPSGDLKDSASPELVRLRRQIRSTQARIVERIQGYVAGKARELLSDPIYTIRDGRYVIPLKAEYKGRIKGIVHDTSASGQTVYLEPDDVLQMGNALREAESAEREECERILAELSEKVGEVAEEASSGIELASEIDLLFAKARLGYAWNGVLPERARGHGIAIEGGRHPLLDPETVVPLTLSLGFAEDGLLITGPNTGGKTVAIKTVGLFALMAQSGMMPPATHVRLGPFTQVWADIGDEQSIEQSLSTFSGHVKNIAEALKGLKDGALVLLDEIGAGTDPAEGSALAKALLTTFQARGARVLASTHYGELKAFAYSQSRFSNAAMEFDPKSLQPTFRLIPGAPGASHALKIAERYGLPSDVVRLAREGLSAEQRDVSDMLEQLEEAQRESRSVQSEADRRAGELAEKLAQAESKLAEAEEARRSAFARATAQVEDALREIRLEAEHVFEQLKRDAGDAKAIERAREDLKALQELGKELGRSLKPEPLADPSGRPLEKGMRVRVEGYSQIGVLLDDPPSGGGSEKASLTVQIGPLKVKAAPDRISAVDTAPDFERSARRSPTLQKAMHARQEIHLRAARAEQALEDLERFLDDAVLAGLSSVRIVHGKGGGVLRKVTQEFLRKHPQVASFRLGEAGEGGDGVTVAVLK